MAPPAGDSSRPEHVGRALSGYGSGAVTALATALLSASAYQLRLLVAAWRYRRSPAPPVCDSRDPRLVVLIPAHDEAGQIASAVRSVHAASYPAERREIVVVADNCSDATADIAEREGATVLERRDAELRGKGQALAWALGRLRNRAFDAIVLMDADCRASANLLQVVAGRLSSGSRAVQVEYTVANPTASGAAALRYAAFALAVSTRPLGRSALGASAGILGTGIALRRDLLERVRWDAFSLAEDLEYHARLVQAGERVEFAPEASVTSPMPTTLDDGARQQSRWASGRRSIARRYAAALLLTGLARRDRATGCMRR